MPVYVFFCQDIACSCRAYDDVAKMKGVVYDSTGSIEQRPTSTDRNINFDHHHQDLREPIRFSRLPDRRTDAGDGSVL